MQKTTKIKPCPYCGSSSVSMKRYHGLYGIECDSCYRPSWAYFTTKRAALNYWNDMAPKK